MASWILQPLTGVRGKQGGDGPFSSAGDSAGQGGQGRVMGGTWGGRGGSGAVGGVVGGKHLRLPVLGV